MRWSTRQVAWLAVALTCAPVSSVHADPTTPTWVLAGQTAAGAIRAVAPRKPVTYLAFAAQISGIGQLRLVVVSCTGSACITEDRTLPGTLTADAAKATLTVTHPKLGKIALTGTIGPGGPDYQQCHAEWGSSDNGRQRSFDYDAIGNDHHTQWSGQVGGKKVVRVNGCGVYQSAGMLLIA